MSTNHEAIQETNTPAGAVELPQPAPALQAGEVVEQLRALRAQIGEVAPLTVAQRRTLRARTRTSTSVLQASINVIGALDNVSQAIGQPAADIRQLYDEVSHWTAVEDELRAMLNGVAGANLVRRHRVALVATQAYTIGTQLVRDPAHAALVPHVEEVKRLKSFKRRKKAGQAPTTPPSPASGTPSPAPAAPKSTQG
jgi:hypothetical protein